MWPKWQLTEPNNSPFFMSKANITTFLKELYSRLQPWLQGDLQRRSPGEFCSSDGTFRLATRTLGDGKCIVFLMGERGEIVAYWALTEESWEQMYAGLHRLSTRLEVLGTLDHLRWWCAAAARPHTPPLALHTSHTPLHLSHTPPPPHLQVRRPLLRRLRAG